MHIIPKLSTIPAPTLMEKVKSMPNMLQVAGIESPLTPILDDCLQRVDRIFHDQLDSDLPPVRDLCTQVSGYSGKMLRPTMLILCGLATCTDTNTDINVDSLSSDHFLLAAVMELVHMATLVHDDVLDEADTRRRGQTINRLHGNEAAVILGDYLISNAYHLCSRTGKAEHALLISETTNIVCEGELLQLHHRDNYSLDEFTYREIIDRKTASLIGLSCFLGAYCNGSDDETCKALERFGRQLGLAFQIRDDLLDLTGTADVVGKSLGKDIEKGKLTLPLIHHLAACDPVTRGRSLELIEQAEHGGSREQLVTALRSTGSVEYAMNEAGRIVEQASSELNHLPQGAVRDVLRQVADAVVSRAC